jgi:guanylate kinase
MGESTADGLRPDRDQPVRKPPTRVVVVSGPSGSGKTTLVSRLLTDPPVPLRKCVSATTRPPRLGERDGEAYYFLIREEFDEKRSRGEFLECAEVHAAGHWYGTLLSELALAERAGAWPLLEIDVQGAETVMGRFPDAVSIFITLPSVEDYERRLRSRGSESEEALQRRLATAREELKAAGRYRHLVVNDDLDRAAAELKDILASATAPS